MIRTSFERRIQDMVGGLDEKEREVIRMRFGLDGDEPKTLQEIGETMASAASASGRSRAGRRRSCGGAARPTACEAT